MGYKSILTYHDGDAGSEERLEAAIGVTRQFDAHLTVAAIGYDPNVPPYAFAEASGAMMVDIMSRARRASEERAASVDAALAKAGILGEAVPSVMTYSEVSRSFGEMCRFADLVVLGRPYGDDMSSTAVDMLEGALFDGDAGVLVCPNGRARPDSPDSDVVLIAWNGSREAHRAIRRAMPFLRRARTVEIIIFDPAPSEREPGFRLAAMLSRHGIPVDIAVQPRSADTIGEALAHRARELGAGLLVMGAYGHSRFREYVLGGPTRSILETLPLRVLMAH